MCLPSEDVEEIRNWVLNMSIDQRSLNTALPLDRRGVFEGNLGQNGRPCVITGYAVFGQGTGCPRIILWCKIMNALPILNNEFQNNDYCDLFLRYGFFGKILINLPALEN